MPKETRFSLFSIAGTLSFSLSSQISWKCQKYWTVDLRCQLGLFNGGWPVTLIFTSSLHSSLPALLGRSVWVGVDEPSADDVEQHHFVLEAAVSTYCLCFLFYILCILVSDCLHVCI